MTIQERLATGRGRYIDDFPEFGTGPVSYEDSISEEFFRKEKQALFKNSWLMVGRVERLARPGSYFTRELPNLASLVITKDVEGKVHAFHNVCAHRGNKVVWQDHPGEECAGNARAFNCKYHGWRYDLEGKVNHVTNEEHFYDLPKSLLAMPQVHVEVFAGFIFINLTKEDPTPLREALGDRLLELEKYPFEKLTQRHAFRTPIKGNWKLAVDSVSEWYHPPYVHGRFLDINTANAEKLVPPIDSYHYDFWDRHMVTSVPGPRPLKPRELGSFGPLGRDQKDVYRMFRAGLFGPDDVADLGELPDFLNPGDIQYWSNDQYWIFPNLYVQIWERNYYITYQYWPVSVGEMVYEVEIYFVPPKNALERLSQELVVDSTIEFFFQDVNTIEATYSAISQRQIETFHLSDQEIMIRALHKNVRDAVAEWEAEQEQNKNGASA